MDRREIKFPTADKTILRGWFYPARDAAVGQKSPCLIMANGLSGLKEQFLPIHAKRFQESGYAALVYDLRNWGDSEGLPRSETNPIQHSGDLSDAFDFAQSLEEVDSTRIVFWGCSMGGGTVIHAAAFDHRIRAVIAEVPFVSGEATAPHLAPHIPSLYTARQAEKLGKPTKLIKMFTDDIELAKKGDPEAFINDPGVPALMEWMAEENIPWCPLVTPQTVLNIIAFEPMAFIHRLAPTPLLLVVADSDLSAPTQVALKAYEQALQPKRLHILRNTGHFQAHYGQAFEESFAAQIEFLKEFV